MILVKYETFYGIQWRSTLLITMVFANKLPIIHVRTGMTGKKHS